MVQLLEERFLQLVAKGLLGSRLFRLSESHQVLLRATPQTRHTLNSEPVEALAAHIGGRGRRSRAEMGACTSALTSNPESDIP